VDQLVGRRLQDFAALVTRDDITPAVADEMMQFWLTHRLPPSSSSPARPAPDMQTSYAA
jgi:hypothetical protein